MNSELEIARINKSNFINLRLVLSGVSREIPNMEIKSDLSEEWRGQIPIFRVAR